MDMRAEKEKIMALITKWAKPFYRDGLEIAKIRLRMYGYDFEEYSISYKIDKRILDGKVVSRKVSDPVFNFSIDVSEDGQALIFKKLDKKSTRHTIVHTPLVCHELKVLRKMKYRMGKREKTILCLDFDEHLYYTDGTSRYSPEEFIEIEND